MAAAGNARSHHKKALGADKSGMNWETKQHFEKVKRKMFAFLDQQRRVEADQNHLPPPPPLVPPAPMFGEKGLKPPAHHHHHRSPGLPRREAQTPFLGHKKLAPAAFATPQVPRRPRI